MTLYIANVLIIVEAETQAEARDAVSECLTHTLEAQGMIKDWSYQKAKTEERYTAPRLLAEDAIVGGANSDLPDLWENARAHRPEAY